MSSIGSNNEITKIHQELRSLLDWLKFSDICADNLPGHTPPEPFLLSDDEHFYPDLSAHKNDYTYLFKATTKPTPKSEEFSARLTKILRTVEKDKSTEFVLVVPYRLKQNYYDWAKENGLSLHNIWEITIY